MGIELSSDLLKKNKNTKKAPGRQKHFVSAILSKEITLFGKRLSDTKKEHFYSELHILLISGVDFKTSLEIVAEQQKKAADKKLFSDIKENVIHGETLSEAVNKTGKFSAYEYYSIKIGEESGRITAILEELSNFFSNKIKQRRQLINTLTYPVLVLVVALAAVIFMMNVIVPMFSEVFKRFGGELPAITGFIISLSHFFRHNLGLIFLIIFMMVLAVIFSRKTLWFRKYSSKVMLRLPYIGSITNMMYLARFCQSMALLSAARTPMLKTIELVKKMLAFYPYEMALTEVEKDILKGKLLNESMAKFRIFDKRIVYLTRVAEEVNQLDRIYSRLHQQYTEELGHKVGMLSSLLEPILIIFVGLLVMVILIAMYLPLFQLSTSVF